MYHTCNDGSIVWGGGVQPLVAKEPPGLFRKAEFIQVHGAGQDRPKGAEGVG